MISTSTNLESAAVSFEGGVRFWGAGGEGFGLGGWRHGDAALPLWSTTKVYGVGVEEFAASKGKALPKDRSCCIREVGVEADCR